MTYRISAGLAALALGAGLAGCATDVSTPQSVRASGNQATSSAAQATSFEAVKAAVNFERDDHMGTRTATGPEIKYLDPERNKWLEGYNIYHIRAFDIGRSGQDVVDFSDAQIRIRQSGYGDWPGYSAAYSEGERFDLWRIDSDVSCAGSSCLKTELVGIDLTMPQLRELAEREIIAFKIVGKRGSMMVEIPQSYVQGFLAAVDERQATGSP